MPTINKQFSIPYSVSIGRALIQRYSDEARRQFVAPYAIGVSARRQFSAPYAASNSISKASTQRYALAALNDVRRQGRQIWDMNDPAVISEVPAVAVTIAGRPFDILAASVRITADGWGWAAQLALADPARLSEIAIDDDVSLTIGGETWSLIVDELPIDRTGVKVPRATVNAISPLASYADPRAARITQTAAAAAGARASVEALLGVAVDWQLPDWTIPAGRLVYTDAVPLDIAKAIAAAAGGIVESAPDGSILVRHQFPVAVSSWPGADVDHTFTDLADNLSVSRTQRAIRRVNNVTVRDAYADSLYLSAETDGRVDGLNAGRIDVQPGQSVGVMVHHDRALSVADPQLSTGTASRAADQAYELTEDLSFDETSSAQLTYPADAILSITWLGTSLGALSLDADQRSLSAAAAGIAIARVVYRVRALAWMIHAPTSAGGATDFPIEALWEATEKQGGGRVNITVRRGGGEFVGDDIVEPLLGSIEAAISRGRADIDAGEQASDATVTAIARAGVRPGQLIECHDAWAGESWRGQAQGVEYRHEGSRATITMEVFRI